MVKTEKLILDGTNREVTINTFLERGYCGDENDDLEGKCTNKTTTARSTKTEPSNLVIKSKFALKDGKDNTTGTASARSIQSATSTKDINVEDRTVNITNSQKSNKTEAENKIVSDNADIIDENRKECDMEQKVSSEKGANDESAFTSEKNITKSVKSSMKSGSKSGSKLGVKTELKSGALSETKSGATSEAKSAITSEAKSGVTSQAKSGVSSQTKSGVTSQTKSGVTCESKPGATLDTKCIITSTKSKTGGNNGDSEKMSTMNKLSNEDLDESLFGKRNIFTSVNTDMMTNVSVASTKNLTTEEKLKKNREIHSFYNISDTNMEESSTKNILKNTNTELSILSVTNSQYQLPGYESDLMISKSLVTNTYVEESCTSKKNTQISTKTGITNLNPNIKNKLKYDSNPSRSDRSKSVNQESTKQISYNTKKILPKATKTVVENVTVNTRQEVNDDINIVRNLDSKISCEKNRIEEIYDGRKSILKSNIEKVNVTGSIKNKTGDENYEITKFAGKSKLSINTNPVKQSVLDGNTGEFKDSHKIERESFISNTSADIITDDTNNTRTSAIETSSARIFEQTEVVRVLERVSSGALKARRSSMKEKAEMPSIEILPNTDNYDMPPPPYQQRNGEQQTHDLFSGELKNLYAPAENSSEKNSTSSITNDKGFSSPKVKIRIRKSMQDSKVRKSPDKQIVVNYRHSILKRLSTSEKRSLSIENESQETKANKQKKKLDIPKSNAILKRSSSSSSGKDFRVEKTNLQKGTVKCPVHDNNRFEMSKTLNLPILTRFPSSTPSDDFRPNNIIVSPQVVIKKDPVSSESVAVVVKPQQGWRTRPRAKNSLYRRLSNTLDTDSYDSMYSVSKKEPHCFRSNLLCCQRRPFKMFKR